MTVKEVEEYLNRETRETDKNGKVNISIRCEPYLNFFIAFCKKNEKWCNKHLTEDNFENIYAIFGSGFNDGFEFASHFKWKN